MVRTYGILAGLSFFLGLHGVSASAAGNSNNAGLVPRIAKFPVKAVNVTCAACVLQAAAPSLLSYPADVQEVTSTLSVVPIVTVYGNSSSVTRYSTLSAYATSTAAYANATTELVWTWSGVSLTYPTTYLAYDPTGISGAPVASSSCPSTISPLPLPHVPAYESFVLPLPTGTSYLTPTASAVLLPPKILSYLDALPSVPAFFTAANLTTCTLFTAVPTINPPHSPNVVPSLPDGLQGVPAGGDRGNQPEAAPPVVKTSVLVVATSTGSPIYVQGYGGAQAQLAPSPADTAAVARFLNPLLPVLPVIPTPALAAGLPGLAAVVAAAVAAGITPAPVAPAPLTLAAGVATLAASGGGLVLPGGQTLTPGAAATTVGGQVVSLGWSPQGAVVGVVDGVTKTLTVPSAAALTVGGVVYAPTITGGSTYWVVGGSTVSAGGVATVGGHVVSLLPGGVGAVVDGTTSYAPASARATLEAFTGGAAGMRVGGWMWGVVGGVVGVVVLGQM